jgi:hypothetical protein
MEQCPDFAVRLPAVGILDNDMLARETADSVFSLFVVCVVTTAKSSTSISISR